MRILELFSGTGSIGRAFASSGWEVVGLDNAKKAKATICTDIRAWEYRVYEPGHFDVIWANPGCTLYIIARTKASAPRDLVWADSLV
jgi:site-specific DNA-cytosine methylase